MHIIDRIYNLPEDDPETWNTICAGDVQGIFQLSGAALHFSKEMKPRSIRELSDLISCIRPGMLGVKIGKVNAAQEFCNRKNGISEVTYIHPAVEPVLKDSYALLMYQEEAIMLAQEIAGFTPQQGDLLRKAIGTKDVEIMADLEKDFIEGCIKTGKVDDVTAKQLFEDIRKSQKYSFNLSLTGDTLVNTLRGNKSILELSVGSYVDSPSGFIKVLNKFDHGIQDVYEVTLEYGYKIKCTMHHKFLCVNGLILRLYEVLLLNQFIKTNSHPEYQSIANVKYIGKEQTYDIEVASKDHIYYGNGIATSNSHGVSYAKISYWDSYLKTHFPLDFYCEKLNQSHHKIKPKIAVNQLVTDAQRHGILIRSPSLEDVLLDEKYKFYHKDGEIVFGINHIKGIGESKILKIREKLVNIRTWMDCLKSGIDKTTLTNLISIGFFSFGLTRKTKLFQYNLFQKLSAREKSLIEVDCLEQGLTSLLDKVNVNRKLIIESLILTLNNPPYSLEDDPPWINSVEMELMGISLSYHKTETEASDADTTCKEVNDGKSGNSVLFVEISGINEYTIGRGKSKGKKMGSFSGSDHTGTCKFLIFDETWTKYQSQLYEGALVTLAGYKSKDAIIINMVK